MRLLIKIMCFGFIFNFCTLAFGEEDAGMQNFVEGNVAFSQQRYAEAIIHYREALSHGKTVPLLFNLGNAYARNREIGLAILNYKRALLYAPRNPEVQANLTFLREQESIPDFPAKFAQVYVSYLTHSTWLYLAVVSFWISLFLIFWRCFYSFKKSYVLCAAFVSLVVFAFATYSTWLSGKLDSRAIVITQGVLKLAPTAKSEDLTPLGSGQELEILSEYQDYAQVRLANQAEGWVKKNTIEQIFSNS